VIPQAVTALPWVPFQANPRGTFGEQRRVVTRVSVAVLQFPQPGIIPQISHNNYFILQRRHVPLTKVIVIK